MIRNERYIVAMLQWSWLGTVREELLKYNNQREGRKHLKNGSKEEKKVYAFPCQETELWAITEFLSQREPELKKTCAP